MALSVGTEVGFGLAQAFVPSAVSEAEIARLLPSASMMADAVDGDTMELRLSKVA